MTEPSDILDAHVHLYAPEAAADPAGTLQIDDVPHGRAAGIRLHAIIPAHR